MKLRNVYICYRFVTLFLLSIPRLIYVKIRNDDKSALYFIKNTCRKLIKAANVDLTTEGVENLDIDENVILISNHVGIYDIIFTLANTNRILGFVAKDSLSKIPIASSWMRYYNSIFIDRNDLRGQVKVLAQAADVVKTKGSICVYPEGTRSMNRGEFKSGTFKIATRSKAPIIPVTVVKSSLLFEDRKTNKKQSAKIVFHKPVFYEEYSKLEKNEIAKHFEDIVYSEYK